jgi:hypothetical protein
MTRLTWRDGVATVLVGLGVVLYILWLNGAELVGPRAIAGIVLGLGLAASLIAVVYGVGAGLLQAPKVYLAVASLLGVLALVAGVLAVTSINETMLATLVAATLAMWLMSTVRHAVTESPRQDRTPRPTSTLSKV